MSDKITCDNCINREVCFNERWGEHPQPIDEPCLRCGKQNIIEEPDKCLKTLPGVSSACCGHTGIGYISFENGVVLRGKFWRCEFK